MKLYQGILGAVLLTAALQDEAQGRGGARGGVARGGSVTGPRGGSVQAGRVGGAAVGPAGGVRAGGASGVRVTTPGGRTATSVQGGRAAVGPRGGVGVSGGHGTAVSGYRGGAAVGTRGGVAAGPYGGVAAGRTVGYAGHSTRYYSGAAVRSSAVAVRGGYYRGAFTTGWVARYPTCWRPATWRYANYWVAPAWNSVALWCGVAAAPIVYDYGTNIVIQNDIVYNNGTEVASAPQYAEQATNLADLGRDAKPPEKDEWQSLGVFGMIQGEEQTAQNIFQIAVNKDGILRGNYYNSVADSNTPIYGSIDKKTQRAAWSIGEKKDIVYEAGLNNLTQEQTVVLAHYGKERTDQMILVRLEEPKDSK